LTRVDVRVARLTRLDAGGEIAAIRHILNRARAVIGEAALFLGHGRGLGHGGLLSPK